jgi:SNF2 family DNA or RNA helicase
MPEFVRWNDTFRDEFRGWDDAKQGRALFIEQHPEYPAYLFINSFDPLFAHSLKDTIGEYRAVHKLEFTKLIDAAESAGFGPIITTFDVQEMYSFLEHLDDPLPVKLNVELRKFQLRGFNYLKDLPACIPNWSTGTGKSVFGVTWAKYLLNQGKVDKIVVLSKNHNKENWKRTFKKIADLEALTDDTKGSTPAARRERRAELYKDAQIFIINYEKMKYRPEKENNKRDLMGRKKPSASGDGQELEEALKGQRVAWIFDEMPTKMKGMQTAWYKGCQKLTKRTKKNYMTMLTATKIERSPENIYSCIKILDKTVWPNLATFRAQYAKRMSDFATWQVATWDTAKLPELGMRLAHMTHKASKYTDPEIRAEFPQDHWEDVWIDMSNQDRKLYDAIKKGILEQQEKNLTITKLIPLQLVCNNPATLLQSESVVAQEVIKKFVITDGYCAKLEKLSDLLDEIEGKVVIFSSFNALGMGMLAPYLVKWNHPFVMYNGNAKQKQLAQDRFRTDSRVKIFLSSDQGSDSIDLEQATSVINYDLPDNYSTLIQRVNRISRLTSEAEHVFYYNLVTADSIEEKKLDKLDRKRLMEEAVDIDLGRQSDILTNSDFDDLRSWLA